MIWTLGLLLLFFGLFLIITAFLHNERHLKFEEENSGFREKIREEKKYGGVVLIGPIPIVFGDTKLAVIALILTITLMLLSLLLIFGWLL